MAGLLALLAAGSPLVAECLGCPPGAQLVDLHLRDGQVVRGYVIIHRSLVRRVIDRKPWPADLARKEVWPGGEVEIWKSALTQRRPFHGASFQLRSWPRERDESGKIKPPPDHRRPLEFEGEWPFRLSSGSVILIGEPQRVALSRIEWIEDASVHEGNFELLSPVYRVSSQNRDLLVEKPLVSLVVRDRRETEDRTYYCFSYLEEMAPLELAERCVDEFDTVERGVVKLLFPGST